MGKGSKDFDEKHVNEFKCDICEMCVRQKACEHKKCRALGAGFKR